MNALIEYLPGQIEVLKKIHEEFANNYGSLKLAHGIRTYDAVSAVDYIDYNYTINVYYNLIELAKEYPEFEEDIKILKEHTFKMHLKLNAPQSITNEFAGHCARKHIVYYTNVLNKIYALKQ